MTDKTGIEKEVTVAEFSDIIKRISTGRDK